MAKYLVVNYENEIVEKDAWLLIDAESARAAVQLAGFERAEVWTLRGTTPRGFTLTTRTETVITETGVKRQKEKKADG